MHFQGAAKRWLSSVEEHLEDISWSEFCSQLLLRFARDEHELLLRRLFQIRQTSPVNEYIKKFVSLVDDLKAYAKHPDPLYYTQRFIEGLRDDIKSVLLVHRPSTLDTACVLAQLQEEALATTRKPFRRYDHTSMAKPTWSGALALPSPPQKQAEGDPKRSTHHPPSVEDKFKALRAARRAQGLCIRCGAKWSRDHKCAELVQINLVQELLDMFPDQDDVDSSDPPSPTVSQVMMHLSVAAAVGSASPKAFSFHGEIQGRPLFILVDSGSSHTFLSDVVAQSLTGVQDLTPALGVQVANGAVLQCTSYIPAATWSVQGYTFSTDLKLLPLSSYDMILGLDWLASLSPMQVHWAQKWLSIPYEGSTVVLFGDAPVLPIGSVLQLCQVQDLTELTVPSAVQALLSEFASLFEPVSGLPPRRPCDHSIPLIPGAQPVFVRPYRYASLLKSEIEQQVSEMLQHDIIQKSTSPFASPVLLVKKKDQSWRFCVDYRQLNAITVKGKYPVPIIEELLDELSGAAYFTTLDLQARFHQIRMKEGEEFKTAFQTHFGQFKFRVMSFGLTGAPGTFQDAMNTLLGPYRTSASSCWLSLMIYSYTVPLLKSTSSISAVSLSYSHKVTGSSRCLSAPLLRLGLLISVMLLVLLAWKQTLPSYSQSSSGLLPLL